MDNIRLGIFPNMNIVKVRVHFDAILDLCRTYNITPVLPEQLAKMYHQKAFDGRHSQLTAAVSLGGDGTFLRMARDMVKYNVPVFGVNFGHLGFLAEIEYETLRQALQLLTDGRYAIEKRCLLSAHEGEVLLVPMHSAGACVRPGRGPRHSCAHLFQE